MSGLFSELSRRKVIRVAVTYGIVGLAVIEAADIIVDAIDLPPQFVVFVIVAIFLGFPIAIVLAWSYDIVPDATARQVRSEDSPDYDAPPRNRRGISPVRAIITVALLVIVGVTWYEFRQSNSQAEARSAPQYVASVAVLPLDNLTGDPGYDHIGIGITEEIITYLARIPPLKVISRHSVQAAAAQNLTTPQVASVLGVRHIIEGSVQFEDDNRIRVTLQHIDAETDAHLWVANLGGPLSNLIEVQEDIARFATIKIVDLIPGLTAPTMNSQVELGPGHKAYLEGKKWLGQRTAEGLNNAVTYFETALELDPGYAPIYADLASSYVLAMSYRYDIDVDGYTMAARAMTLAEKAIELDGNLAAGYAARGLLGIQIGHSPTAIATDFDRAESLSPNSAANPSWRSLAQAQLGNTETAFAEAARAVDLDPLSPARQIAMANVAFQLGRYDEAIAASRIATALEPRLIRGRAIEARSQILNGDPENCANLVLGAYRVLRATCLAAAGETEQADLIVQRVLSEIADGQLREPGYTEVITFEELATYYAISGNTEKAQEYLMRAFDASPGGVEFRVLDSPLFNSARSDGTFREAVGAVRAELYNRVQRLSANL
jgi:TolB-like protein